MKRKNLLLFILLLVVTVVGLVLFYKFSRWYQQLFGSVFSYIVMISLVMFIFAPFRFMKDKKADVNIFSYIKYLGVTVLVLAKFVVNVLKQTVFTISYVVSKLLTADVSGEK